MNIRTWHVELSFVAAILFIIALMTGATGLQFLGAAAVTLTFAHAQVAERLAEREAQRASSATVECYYMARRYFLGKEVLWCLYFIWLQAWPALAGVALFLAYPLWRRWWRRRHPVGGRTIWFKRKQDRATRPLSDKQRCLIREGLSGCDCAADHVAIIQDRNTAEAGLEGLMAQVKRLVAEGVLSAKPTRAERIDFAYGNTRLSNPAITRQMVEDAADKLDQALAAQEAGKAEVKS